MTDWVTKVENETEEKFERWNPNRPYAPPPPVAFSERDQILYDAVKKAVDHGWRGFIFHVNDAVTIGHEAFEVTKYYVRTRRPLEPLLFDHDFAHCMTEDSEEKETYLIKMAIAQDRISCLSSFL